MQEWSLPSGGFVEYLSVAFAGVLCMVLSQKKEKGLGQQQIDTCS